jgi:hypothetical protein
LDRSRSCTRLPSQRGRQGVQDDSRPAGGPALGVLHGAPVPFFVNLPQDPVRNAECHGCFAVHDVLLKGMDNIQCPARQYNLCAFWLFLAILNPVSNFLLVFYYVRRVLSLRQISNEVL